MSFLLDDYFRRTPYFKIVSTRMVALLIKIGFLSFGIWDLLDVLIVGYLIFQTYKLLKGSIVFNIFIGVVVVLIVSWVVNFLKMTMLGMLLNQIISVGALVLLVVFQPEIRRLLVFLGRSAIRQRSNFFSRYVDQNLGISEQQRTLIRHIKKALEIFAKTKTGALLIFTPNPDILGLANPGTPLHAEISTPLLQSIFQKESPLHDGAVIISAQKIYSASAVLPVSDSTELPKEVGLRHRAAVGITEGTRVFAVVVSEETGKISYARNGKLSRGITLDEMERILQKVFGEY